MRFCLKSYKKQIICFDNLRIKLFPQVFSNNVFLYFRPSTYLRRMLSFYKLSKSHRHTSETTKIPFIVNLIRKDYLKVLFFFIDNDGDKITIFNEEDIVIFKLLKGRKLFIDVVFTESTAREANIANNLPEDLDVNLDVYDRYNDNANFSNDKRCSSSPSLKNSEKVVDKSNTKTLPMPKKFSMQIESRKLIYPIQKINTAIADKFEDTQRNIFDENDKNKEEMTMDFSSTNSNLSALADEFQYTSRNIMDRQDKSNDNYSEDVQGACYLPFSSNNILNKPAEKCERRSILLVPKNEFAEKKKKAVRFSLPYDEYSVPYEVYEEIFEPRNIRGSLGKFYLSI